jgi:hypothetical protein
MALSQKVIIVNQPGASGVDWPTAAGISRTLNGRYSILELSN